MTTASSGSSSEITEGAVVGFPVQLAVLTHNIAHRLVPLPCRHLAFPPTIPLILAPAAPLLRRCPTPGADRLFQAGLHVEGVVPLGEVLHLLLVALLRLVEYDLRAV